MSTIAPSCYRVIDLARRWQCSPSKIRALINDGKLPNLGLGRMFRIPIAAVAAIEDQWRKQHGSDTPLSKAAVDHASVASAREAARDARIMRALQRRQKGKSICVRGIVL